MLLPAAAGTALGATALVSAGAVPIGGTSALPATFTFTENRVGGFPSFGGTITVTILDANDAPTLTFTDATGGTAVPTLDPSTTLQGASVLASGNTFTVTTTAADSGVVQAITVGNLYITSSANAAVGAINATSSGTIDPSTYGTLTTTASGTLAEDYPGDASSVVVNLTSTCPFVNVGNGAGLGGDFFIAGNDAGASGTATAVGALVLGQQTLSGFSASLPALVATQPVSQSNVPNCSPGSLGVVGVVGGSIGGSVTAIGGAPLAGIRMVACPPQGYPCSFANSAADGTYSMIGLPVGPYQVSFGDPNHVYPTGFYAPEQPGNFTLDVSAVAGQYVAVPASGVTLDAIVLPLGRSISGVVTDANGNPLSGIFVYPCEQHDGGALNDCGNPRSWEPVSTTTDSSGKFSTWGVADGRSYVVELSDPSSAHASGFYDAGSTNPAGYTPALAGATPVPVNGMDVGGITVDLPIGLVISGTVTGPRGTPRVAPIVIQANDLVGNPFPISPAPDGSYALAVPPGSYAVGFFGDPTYASGCYDTNAPGNLGVGFQGCTRVVVLTSDVTGIDVQLLYSQTIAFGNPGPMTMAQSPYTASATASSGLVVKFTASPASVCTARGKTGQTITFVSTGLCSVTASQAGNTVYSAALPVTQTFAITTASQTIAFGSLKNRRLAQSPFTVDATASSGLTPVTFTTSTPSVCTTGGKNGATITLVGRGTCTVKADQAGNAVYSPAPSVSRSFTVS
jgi:hypothetical protein